MPAAASADTHRGQSGGFEHLGGVLADVGQSAWSDGRRRCARARRRSDPPKACSTVGNRPAASACGSEANSVKVDAGPQMSPASSKMRPTRPGSGGEVASMSQATAWSTGSSTCRTRVVIHSGWRTQQKRGHQCTSGIVERPQAVRTRSGWRAVTSGGGGRARWAPGRRRHGRQVVAMVHAAVPAGGVDRPTLAGVLREARGGQDASARASPAVWSPGGPRHGATIPRSVMAGHRPRRRRP
jgi:hypothetical protein